MYINFETFMFSCTFKTRQSSCQRYHPVLYCGTCIRPVLEYAFAVFHYSLPKYLSEDMERIQERAHSINAWEFVSELEKLPLQILVLPKFHSCFYDCIGNTENVFYFLNNIDNKNF